jgi:hypothetical protein
MVSPPVKKTGLDAEARTNIDGRKNQEITYLAFPRGETSLHPGIPGCRCFLLQQGEERFPRFHQRGQSYKIIEYFPYYISFIYT